MAVSRWDPFRELASLQEGLDRMFRDIDRTRTAQNFISSQWTPRWISSKPATCSSSSWRYLK